MSIEKQLSGGDPRTLGNTEQIVQQVLSKHEKLAELFNCLKSDNQIVRMRASDGLEKICRQKPNWFNDYADRLLNDVSKINQPSVQWHLAQMLAEIQLTEVQKQQALKILRNNVDTTEDWIVENLTLESLASFVRRGDFPKTEYLAILNEHGSSRHKSVRARVSKLLKEFTE